MTEEVRDSSKIKITLNDIANRETEDQRSLTIGSQDRQRADKYGNLENDVLIIATDSV